DAIHEMTEGGYGFHRIYKNIIRRIKEANVEQIRKEVMEGGEL
ncbi:protein tyrosine phosphatase, partial [Bacteroides ovatus]